jgi:hypothetical protein
MEYNKPNSHKSKELAKEQAPNTQKKNIGKVIDGQAKIAKKGEFQKAVDAFLPEEGISGIKDHIIMDVVIPTIKKIISDTVETLLYGATGMAPRNGSNSNKTKTSYGSYYSRKEEEERYSGRPVGSSRLGAAYSYEEIVLETRGQALSVIACMEEIIDTYECVSVADLYEMVDLTGNYTDNNYGWLDLRGAQVIQLRRGGYALKLPKPVKLPSTVVG